MSSAVRDVTLQLFCRYRTLLESSTEISGPSSKQQLLDLIDTAIEKSQSFPIDKLNRWLGFVQAALIFNGLTSVLEERDFSRPLFHAAYLSDGIEIPETINISK